MATPLACQAALHRVQGRDGTHGSGALIVAMRLYHVGHLPLGAESQQHNKVMPFTATQ